MIKSINKKYNLCGILSCSFYYGQDYPYIFSSVKNAPFYCLFKEYMKDEIMVNTTIEKYKKNQYKFHGDTIFLANNCVKKILIDSSVCDDKQLKVIGSPRFDEIFYSDRLYLNKKRNQITLFSFFHSSGLVRLKCQDNFFTSDENDGFFNLFRDTHITFVELAEMNKDIDFVIKTKFDGHWHDQINQTIYDAMGIDLKNVTNIKLIAEGSVHDIIRDSSVVVAFNSTTVLESLAMGVDVVLPIFHEAKYKYSKTNVMFTKYFKYLNIASSKEQLMNKVLEGHFDQNKKFNLPEQMAVDFIGYFDGNSVNRFIKKIV